MPDVVKDKEDAYRRAKLARGEFELRGVVTTMRPVRGGKEVTFYIVNGPEGPLAVIRGDNGGVFSPDEFQRMWPFMFQPD